MDEKFLVNAIQKTKVVATLEEHNKLCGLGSAISEIISSNSLNKKQYFFGINDTYKKAGSYQHLKKEYNLLNTDIFEKLKGCLNVTKWKVYKFFYRCTRYRKKHSKWKFKYNEIPEWDSIGHMTLISNLEDAFEISFETDDIVDFSSFNKGKEILKKNNIKI